MGKGKGSDTSGKRNIPKRKWLSAALVLLLLLSAALKWWQDGSRIAQAQTLGWYQLSREPTQLLPEARSTPEAVVAVLAAPTYGWRGYFAVHPWIVYKRADDPQYTRYEVIGWRRHDVVRRNHAPPDAQWYGATPEVLVKWQGQQAANLIPQIEAAIQSYPYPQHYRSYPGPNSNTFLAHIGREVPGLTLDLPPTAIGKDYRPWTAPIGLSPSGQGLQLSIEGVLGVIVSLQEGLELNLLGLNLGIDLNCPALRLPFVGRLGLPGSFDAHGCGTTGPQASQG